MNQDARLKILLVGDASNCHHSLAVGLRRLGHDVTVASDGNSYMQTVRDVDLNRRWFTKVGGMLHWLRLQWLFRRRFCGYDVVSIIKPDFLWLRPQRIQRLFDLLKRNNRSVFLTASNTDGPFIEECLDPNSALRYNEYRIGDKLLPFAQSAETKAFITGEKRKLWEHVYAGLDGAVAVLYEYYVALGRMLPKEKYAYAGIPIVMEDYPFVEKKWQWPLTVFMGRKKVKADCKGYEFMAEAARRVAEQYPDKVVYQEVIDVPLNEYTRMQAQAHIMLDQAYSYTPATNALAAMAMGLTAVSGAEPDYYDFIGERDNHPIANALPSVEANEALLIRLISDPMALQEVAEANRRFVEEHHDCEKVAAKFLEFWRSRLQTKSAAKPG